MPRKTAGKLSPKKTAKQIATATKTILAYEEKQKQENMVLNDNQVRMEGFVIGTVVVLIADLLVRALSV